MRDNVGNGPRRRKRFRGRAERPIAWGTPVCRSTARGYIEGRKRAEGWPSGLRRTLGKRVYGKPYRGFESHSLRQHELGVIIANLTVGFDIANQNLVRTG